MASPSLPPERLEKAYQPAYLGARIERAAMHRRVEDRIQLLVILIAEGDETEGLEAGALSLTAAHGPQHLGHGVDRTGARLEGNFHEITSGEFALHLEQAAGDGNGLKLCARAATALHMDGSCNGSVEVDSGRTPGGVGLGEVSHSQRHYDTGREGGADYQSSGLGVCWGMDEPGIGK